MLRFSVAHRKSIVPYGCGVSGISVQLPVRLAQAQGNGAGRAVAYSFAIYLGHRHDTARSARYEHLVRAPHLIGPNRSLFERDAVFTALARAAVAVVS